MTAPLSPAQELSARRTGRAVFGLALTAGMVVVWMVSFGGARGPSWGAPPPLLAGQALVAVWLAALLLAGLARSVARVAFSADPTPLLEVSGGGPTLPVACPLGIASGTHRAERLEAWGLALPLVGLSFAAPLSLHFVVGALLGVGARDFNQWVALSSILVGHAHLLLAALAGAYALSLCRRDGAGPALTSASVLGFTTAAAAIPGIFLLGLPPVLTLLTGLLFVPAMFGWARRTVCAERAVLAGGSR